MSFNNRFYHEADSESPISPLPDALCGLVPQIVLVSHLNSILQLRFGEIELIVSHQPDIGSSNYLPLEQYHQY
jgi:hypothetical protein